jgi:hypothetical protein
MPVQSGDNCMSQKYFERKGRFKKQWGGGRLWCESSAAIGSNMSGRSARLSGSFTVIEEWALVAHDSNNQTAQEWPKALS